MLAWKSIFSGVLLFSMLFLVGCGFQAAPEQQRTVEIGLLLRQQFSTSPCDVKYYRHVHMLLPGGKIMGFNKRGGEVGVLQYMFTNIDGEVRDLKKLHDRGDRYHYIRAGDAMDAAASDRPGEMMVTDWARFKVTPDQADALVRDWNEMFVSPPSFRLFGKNCASRACEAMVRSGILPWGLPGLDRPENLLKRVKQFYPDLTIERGFFGFDDNEQPYMIPLPDKCNGKTE